jgi:hypothetical protein
MKRTLKAGKGATRMEAIALKFSTGSQSRLLKSFYEFGVRKALDIRCATGPLVKAFIDTGIDAYGADVSE